jgi:hypothetical protein
MQGVVESRSRPSSLLFFLMTGARSGKSVNFFEKKNLTKKIKTRIVFSENLQKKESMSAANL